MMWASGNSLDLHMLPKDIDPWAGRPDCPAMLKTESDLGEVADLPDIPGPKAHDKMSRLYADVTGTYFHPISAKDCLTQAACTPEPLPPGFTRELFEWAMN